ncbi:hypothetical protein [Parenemella sanctibonifatiensis]|uniref:hypothetical protein n=1 Tax=Parenemella sanctibonifatiensis TaxID=2016505 RepID=UPI0015C5F36A|nr:hypothetical protein [Parenemella sanctibonifatiensis]
MTPTRLNRSHAVRFRPEAATWRTFPGVRRTSHRLGPEPDRMWHRRNIRSFQQTR